MEQLLGFILTVTLSTVGIVCNLPWLFLTSFVIGVAHYAIRSKQKGWKLPKNIRDTHGW